MSILNAVTAVGWNRNVRAAVSFTREPDGSIPSASIEVAEEHVASLVRCEGADPAKFQLVVADGFIYVIQNRKDSK